jgi:hypothetical protein
MTGRALAVIAFVVDGRAKITSLPPARRPNISHVRSAATPARCLTTIARYGLT